MLCFSFTLPATRLAVPEFGSYLVGFGRSAVAGVLALALLLLLKERCRSGGTGWDWALWRWARCSGFPSSPRWR